MVRLGDLESVFQHKFFYDSNKIEEDSLSYSGVLI